MLAIPPSLAPFVRGAVEFGLESPKYWTGPRLQPPVPFVPPTSYPNSTPDSPIPNTNPEPQPQVKPWNHPQKDPDLDDGSILFRSMKGNVFPERGEDARSLGVRPNIDVIIEDGLVNPKKLQSNDFQGMSVNTVVSDLPEWRRPKAFGGNGPDKVWYISRRRIPPSLQVQQQGINPNHYVVAPVACMKYEDYKRDLQRTQVFWGEHSSPTNMRPWYVR